MNISFRSVTPWMYLSLFVLAVLALLVAHDLRRRQQIRDLVVNLEHSEAQVAGAAAKDLNEFGRDIIPYLLPRIEDMNSQARSFTAKALRGIDSAIPSLVEELESEKSSQREAAVEVLGAIGPSAGEAVDPLLDALGDASVDVRTAAAIALGEINDASAIEPIILTVENTPSIGKSLNKAIAKFGARAVGPLSKRLASTNKDVWIFAISALGYVGPDASPAVPELLDLLDSRHEETSIKAAWALGRIRDRRAIEPLFARKHNPILKSVVIEAMGEFGPDAAKILPFLKVHSWHFDLHDVAIAARKKIGPETINEIEADERDYESLKDAVGPIKLLKPDWEYNYDAIETAIQFSFRWQFVAKPGQLVCSTVYTDTGANPFDGRYANHFPAGRSTEIKPTASYARYDGKSFEWGVESIACLDKQATCEYGYCKGRPFRSPIEVFRVE